MKASKFLILFMCFSFAGFLSSAQNTGFGGKKIFFELKAINGIDGVAKGFNVNYSLSRKLSVGMGVNLSSAKYAQIYKMEEYLVWYDGKKKIPEKAKVTTTSLNLNVKLFRSSMVQLPSPAGWYYFADLEAGFINIDGSYYKSLIQNASSANDVLIGYSYKKLPFASMQVGMGYNTFLLDWLTLGASLSLHDYYYFSSLDAGTIPDRVSMGVKKTYGINLVDFARIGDGNPFSRYNEFKYKKPQANYLGLSCFINVGFLLF